MVPTLVTILFIPSHCWFWRTSTLQCKSEKFFIQILYWLLIDDGGLKLRMEIKQKVNKRCKWFGKKRFWRQRISKHSIKKKKNRSSSIDELFSSFLLYLVFLHILTPPLVPLSPSQYRCASGFEPRLSTVFTLSEWFAWRNRQRKRLALYWLCLASSSW